MLAWNQNYPTNLTLPIRGRQHLKMNVPVTRFLVSLGKKNVRARTSIALHHSQSSTPISPPTSRLVHNTPETLAFGTLNHNAPAYLPPPAPAPPLYHTPPPQHPHMRPPPTNHLHHEPHHLRSHIALRQSSDTAERGTDAGNEGAELGQETLRRV